MESLPDEHARPERRQGGWSFALGRAARLSPLTLFAMLAGIWLGGFALRHVQPRFTSSALVVIDPKRPGSFGADTEFANVYIDTAKVASVETVMVSSGLLQRVVESLHLDDDPAFSAQSHSFLETHAPFLLPRQQGVPPDGRALRKARAVERLRLMITTARVSATYIIRLDVTTADAALSQRLAQAVADAYVNDLADTKLQAARRDYAWVSDQVREQREALIRSEVDVEAIRKRYGLIGAEGSNDGSIDRDSVKQVNEELAKAEGDLAAAAARYEQMRTGAPNHARGDAVPDIAGSPAVEALRLQQAEAARKLAELSSHYGPAHPARKQAERELQTLEQQLSAEVARAVASVATDYRTAMAHRDNLARNVAKLMGRINATSSGEGRVELREATRVAEADRIAYEASLTRLRDLEQQQTRLDVEARILSAAELPEHPSSPKPAIFLGGGGALGLLLGTACVGLSCLRRSRVADAASAERDLLLPVLAMIPNLHKPCGAGGERVTIPDYLAARPFSPFADSLRLLRLRLKHASAGESKIVQVTSSVSGEGKSTVASCLAISAASAGLHTILVDLDMHQPTLGRIMAPGQCQGQGQAQGITDVLAGSARAEAVVRTHPSLPMKIFHAGTFRSLDPKLLEGSSLRDLIDLFRRECDLVIIDTPPVLAISDPLFISDLADAVIMVVAWNATPQSMVDNAIAALRSANAQVAGIVLNRVEPSGMSGYYDPHYGYEAA